MKKLFLILVIFLVSCSKEQKTQELTQKPTPTYIQIEAIHVDGSTTTSEVVLVR